MAESRQGEEGMQKGPAVAGKERECGKDGSKALGMQSDCRDGTDGMEHWD